MEILEAFDLNRCPWTAGKLAGCDHKTVRHWVAVRDAGGDPFARSRRSRIVDPFLEKIEELVERSHGRIRADVVHERLLAMGFAGNERSTRRAVAEAKEAYLRRRALTHLPAVGPRTGDVGAACCSARGWPGAGSGW